MIIDEKMAFRQSKALFAGNHFYLGKFHDFCQWELRAPAQLRHVIPDPTNSANRRTMSILGESNLTQFRLDRHISILRGSGLHGPENTVIFRLSLWNRLKQRRPQREVPTLEEMRNWNKLEVCCVWFTWGYLLFYWPMGLYGSHFAKEHDHLPWCPSRTDGSHGEGPTFWYLE